MSHEQSEHARDATDRIAQQDRVSSKDCLMLPVDETLTADQIEAVRQAVKDFITDSDGAQEIPNNQIASEIGFSPAVVSEFMRGKYKGNRERLARQLNLWIDRHRRRERARGNRAYIQTWAAEKMAAWVRLADRRQKMAAIVGPSGCGKDMVIEVLAEELNGAVVYCDTRTTATTLVRKVAEAIGVKVITDTSQLERRIIKRLKDRSMILFINEAQTLAGRGKVGAACAGLLRSIYDQTNVPVVLFGSAEILGFIDDRDPASGGGQLYRRCMKLNLLNLARNEQDPDRPDRLGRPLFSRDEIRRFLAMKRVKLSGDDAFELLYRIANLTEHGTLGLCGDVVEAIADLWPGEAATPEHIYTALSIQLDAELEVVQARIESAQAADRKARPAMAG